MNRKSYKNDIVRQLLDCIRIQNRFTFKAWWFYLILILWTGILLTQTLIIMPEHQEIGTSLTLSAYWVQILIFLGLFVGYFYGKNEYSNNCDELMVTLPNGYVLKQISKIINLILIAGIIFITSDIAIISYFLLKDIDMIYYFPSIQYIFLYWVIPFIISGTFGIILGNILFSKLAYFFIILIGLLTGPLCMGIIDPLLDQFKIVLHPYFMTINIGQMDPHKGMNSLFGYEMQKDLWIIRLLLILCLVIVLLMLFCRYQKNKLKKKITVYSLISIVIILIVSYTISFKYVKMHYYRYTMDDIEKKYSIEENIKKDKNEFEIINSNIKMNINNDITMFADMNIKPTKTVNEINFVLFQGFKIDTIKINNNDVAFIREKDNIKILNKFIVNKDFNIRISYKGLPVNYFYQDTNAWMLPTNFAWIPFIGNESAIVTNSNDIYDISFNYNEQKKPIEYEITYEGPGKPICSLEAIGINHWKGKSPIGITMVNGWLKKGKTEENIDFYYPASYKKYNEYVPKMIKQCKKNETIIKNDFNIIKGNENKVRSYMFLPNVFLRNDGIYNFGDHCIVSINEAYIEGDFLVYPDVTINWVLESTIYNNHWNNKQSYIKEAFTHSYITWCTNRYKNDYLNSNLSSANMLLDRVNIYEQANEKDRVKIYKKLSDFIMTNNNNRIKQFFNDWLEMAYADTEIKWNDLEKLMK
ncbi:hypothetical protein [Clostridium sp. FP1]|uniref:hypothetical protein n=1 Tax=Clostridium sp. FP1 TaxID=2724076 RepID=UPI0013E94B49|nr:hypothetical protein [Clostridium sp. FP1]MBZ9637683.1 hypothetical protein [Clostridium sp. FP1]